MLKGQWPEEPPALRRFRGEGWSCAMNERDPEKLKLLYERFRDVCLVEKEVWKELFMPRDVPGGGVRLPNIQDRYEGVIDDPEDEAVLEGDIPLRAKPLDAAIAEYKDAISF